jgi:hypothetical protein
MLIWVKYTRPVGKNRKEEGRRERECERGRGEGGEREERREGVMVATARGGKVGKAGDSAYRNHAALLLVLLTPR